MSMFTVTGRVMNVFEQQGTKDKETGVLGESSIKVQLLGDMPVVGGGTRLDLVTLTIEDKNTYQALQDKVIRVPLGFFAPKSGQIIHFIPKGSIPEVVTATNAPPPIATLETAQNGVKSPLFNPK